LVFDWSLITDWVQAIGSIAAVWAAFAIFSRQSREHNARERAASEARVFAAKAVLERCREAVRRANSKMTRGTKGGFALGNVGATEEDLDECINLLCSIPLFELPNTDLVNRIMNARYWITTARRRTVNVRAALDSSRPLKKDDYAEPLKQLTACAEF
jgi:hypothetical protein